MGTGSRERILETTARLLREQGYHATGLNQIIKESCAPKGSLYYHFPGGKEQLAAEAVIEGGRVARDLFAAAFSEGRTTAQALDHFVLTVMEELKESCFIHGCPVATVALEASATSDPIHQACTRVFSGFEDFLTGCLVREGHPPERARQVALTLLSCWEGALILSRAHRDLRPLEAMRATLGRLLKPPG